MASHAFADERRAHILQLLDQESSVQVAALAQALGVSAVAIRNDLDSLERDGKLRRTHGGAVALSRAVTVSIQDQRVNVNAQAKEAIGRGAAALVQDGQSVLVDSGTTALEFVRALAAKRDVTVVTPDVTVAELVDRSLPHLDAVLLGGSLRKGHRYVTGPVTLAALDLLHADWAFVCPTSVVAGRGFMTNYAPMAEVKAQMLLSASRRVVLADHGKMGASGLVRFGGPGDADMLLTDEGPGEEIAAYLAEGGCEVRKA